MQPATGARRGWQPTRIGPQAPGHADTWIDEGCLLGASQYRQGERRAFSDAQPVFQLASPAAGTQLLTRSADEQRAALAQGHRNDEEVAFTSARSRPPMTAPPTRWQTMPRQNARLPVNGRFSSRLNGTDDVDWLRVTLTAGKAYTRRLTAAGLRPRCSVRQRVQSAIRRSLSSGASTAPLATNCLPKPCTAAAAVILRHRSEHSALGQRRLFHCH